MILETAVKERRRANLARVISVVFKFACALLGLSRELSDFRLPLSEAEFIRQWRVVEGEFDADFYRRSYSDVETSGIDPLAHFLDYGWLEGRNPNPSFSVRKYLRANPDVARARINPFHHYLQSGRHEGRTAHTSNPIAPYTQTMTYRFSWPASLPNISTRIAITYARSGTHRSCFLGVFDMASRHGHLISLSRYAQISGRGLTQDAKTLYVAFADGADSFLAFFDKDELTLREMVRLPGVLDVHSICLHEGAIFAVSTGTDELVRVTFGTGGASVETIWSPTNSHSEQHHLNSVISYRGELLCSAFGQRTGDSWIDARDGYVYNVSAGECLVRGLYHPHSLAELGGRLYLCESASSAIRPIVFSGASRADLGPALNGLDGYVRGLAFSPDGTGLVGTSVGRYAGQVGHVVSSGDNERGRRMGRCAVQFVDPRTETVGQSRLEFSAVSDEIYDIAWLTSDHDRPFSR